MNCNLHEWYLDVEIVLQDGQLEKRLLGIKKCVETLEKEKASADAIAWIVALVELYYGIPSSEEKKNAFADFFSAEDSSFSVRYAQELALLAGATLAALAEDSSYFDLVELLSLAVSFSRTPASALGILEHIRAQFDADRIELREKVENVSIRSFPTKQITELEKVNAEGNVDASEQITEIIHILKAFQTSHSDLKKQVQQFGNATSIYKEESQLLWWILSEWSELLNCSLHTVKVKTACLVLGWEGADMVENFPGPYAMEGAVQKQLRTCVDGTEEIAPFTLSEIVANAAPELRANVIKACQNAPLVDMLPLCSALVRSDNTESESEWYPKYCRDLLGGIDAPPRTFWEYAWQIYLERLVLRCCSEL